MFIGGQNSKSSSDIFKNLTKEDLRENFTAPDLSRSTLVDQIDYDLDNFKVNESSLESSYISNQNLNCSTLRDNKRYWSDVTPKLMGFLNKEKINKNAPIIHFTKSSLDGDSSRKSKEEKKVFEFHYHEGPDIINNLKGSSNFNSDKNIIKIEDTNGHNSLRASFKRPDFKPVSFINEDKQSIYNRPRQYHRRRNSEH